MLIRTLSGAVLLAILLAVGILGGPLLLVFVLLLSLIGIQELMNAFAKRSAEEDAFRWTLTAPVVIVSVMTIIYDLLLYIFAERFSFIVFVITVLLLLIPTVLAYPRIKARQAACALFAFFYVSVLFSCLLLVRAQENGQMLFWLIFLSSWGADTCAYLAGMAIGKHPLAPVLSPKKTVEGALGGVLGAIILTIIYAIVFKQPVFRFALTAALASVFSIIGDLAASAIKRQHKVKDFGFLIPGHGGVLDRFDSVLFTAPLIYLLSLWLLR